MNNLRSGRKEFYNLKDIFSDFYNQLKALGTYVESIEQILANKHKDEFEEHKQNLLDIISLNHIQKEAKESEEKREELKQIYRNIINEKKDFFDANPKKLNHFKFLEQWFFGENNILGEEITLVDENDEEIIFENLDSSNFKVPKKEYVEKLREKSKILDEIKRHKELLYKSSFISLVVTFELLINGILYHRAYNFPDSMGIDKKTIQFSEIKKIGNIEEVMNYLIEDDITDIMRKSFKEWIEYIKKNFKISVDEEYKELERNLIEIFQRRNLIVHAGGIVNNIYMRNVETEFRDTFRVGEKIEITKEYLKESIEKMELYGVNLIYKYWYNFKKTDKDRDEFLGELAYEELKRNNYISSRNLYSLIIPNTKIQSELYMYKFNYWQTYKWLGDLDKIVKDIRDFDLSAATLDYQFCKEILLDDFEAGFEKFKELIESNQYSFSDLLDWPILKEFLSLDYVKEYIESKDPYVLA